jgi:hypothetical protein
MVTKALKLCLKNGATKQGSGLARTDTLPMPFAEADVQ